MRAILHEVMTGDPVTELPVSALTWSSGVKRPDSVSVTSPGYVGESLYQFMVPRKFAVTAVEDSGVVRACGVLSVPADSDDEDDLDEVSFPGTGIESLFEHRYVLPYPFRPLVDSAGYPIPIRDTLISGVDYGTMMKRLYVQQLSHPGFNLELLRFAGDRPGSREKQWTAVDGKRVQDAVEDISQLVGGVEWDWVPTLDDNDRLTLTLVTGFDDAPEISSSFQHTWRTSGSDPDVRGLKVKVSPEFMTAEAIFTGGKDDDRVMVGHASSTALMDAGIPATQVWDSSHSSVSEQSTLDEYAARAVQDGSTPIQFWSLQVRADRASGLRHGDKCALLVEDHTRLPDGFYERRVVEVTGGIDSEWLSLVVEGEMSW